MNPEFLDFEQPIAELEAKIDELRQLTDGSELNLSDEITCLREKCHCLTESIFAKLTPWQISQLARHPRRPHLVDYLDRLFTDVSELHGDRAYADDAAIVTAIARFNGEPVAIIGQRKGRDTKEKLRCNFGMPRPEGYRKALRIMRLAERFGLPVLTFIDTPGAYPGVGAEERGQSEAIARNLAEMSTLRTPVICTVIGEGGSGGALAIGVGDHTIMLEYSTYSVISPEGCASILWKSAEQAPTAAEALGITSNRLLELGLIDEVVAEPMGGAHQNYDTAAESLGRSLIKTLRRLQATDLDALLELRYQRLMNYGRFEECAEVATDAAVLALTEASETGQAPAEDTVLAALASEEPSNAELSPRATEAEVGNRRSVEVRRLDIAASDTEQPLALPSETRLLSGQAG